MSKKSLLIKIYEDDFEYLKNEMISISPLACALLHKFVADHQQKNYGAAAAIDAPVK